MQKTNRMNDHKYFFAQKCISFCFFGSNTYSTYYRCDGIEVACMGKKWFVDLDGDMKILF